ncbi:membrane-anchored protein [Pseudomonas alkylphenolica]|uniref:Membrane-anchored protein n=1 Tax=Pseudomonas alkylphenolica TaxID=237609 RepID=A0A077FFT4_9PSED|nr:membrane-anchored protein [Pseudomonas alkylphenolica]
MKSSTVWLNKVPEVTLSFWIIKIMSTTVGETFADFLAVDVGWGLGITSVVMAVLLAGALFIQLGLVDRQQRPGPQRRGKQYGQR